MTDAPKPSQVPEGPYWWRRYANEPEDVEQARALGIQPPRMLTNEGQVAIMAGDPNIAPKRIALIDCQTRYKRGQGHKTECAERDALADLFAAAPDLLAVAKHFEKCIEFEIAHSRRNGDEEGVRLRTVSLNLTRAAISKAEGRS